MTPQEIGLVVTSVGAILGLGWKLYDITVGRQKSDAAQDIRIANLETELKGIKGKLEVLDLLNERVGAHDTKIGLFWRLVEDHMTSLLAKSNPIHLEPHEKAAAAIYDAYKRHSPTKTLKTLEPAIRRELAKGYLDASETHVFVMLLGAIQSQLYDRGEWTPDARA